MAHRDVVRGIAGLLVVAAALGGWGMVKLLERWMAHETAASAIATGGDEPVSTTAVRFGTFTRQEVDDRDVDDLDDIIFVPEVTIFGSPLVETVETATESEEPAKTSEVVAAPEPVTVTVPLSPAAREEPEDLARAMGRAAGKEE